MKITSIEYRETMTFGDYQNVTIGATAEADGEDRSAFKVLNELKDWVQVQLFKRVTDHGVAEQEAYELREKGEQLRRLETKLQEADRKWERIKAFFNKNDIPLPGSYREDDLPF